VVAGDAQNQRCDRSLAGNNSFAVTRDGRFWIWGVELGGTGLLARNLKLPTPFPLP
jgi:hypothetical protein